MSAQKIGNVLSRMQAKEALIRGELSRKPNADEQAGMDWWNCLSVAERRLALLRAAEHMAPNDPLSADVSVADAWRVFNERSK